MASLGFFGGEPQRGEGTDWFFLWIRMLFTLQLLRWREGSVTKINGLKWRESKFRLNIKDVPRSWNHRSPSWCGQLLWFYPQCHARDSCWVYAFSDLSLWLPALSSSWWDASSTSLPPGEEPLIKAIVGSRWCFLPLQWLEAVLW